MLRRGLVFLFIAVVLNVGCVHSVHPRPPQALTPVSFTPPPRAALSIPPPVLTKKQVDTFSAKNVRVTIWAYEGKSGAFFTAGMAIDADGAPNAYDPEDKRGLDYLANAGHKGAWWGLATDTGGASGHPLVQTTGEFKGFYIAQTALRDPTKPDANIGKYVDSRLTPFIALPQRVIQAGVVSIGDLAVVYNTRNGRLEYAIVADQGPNDSIGEGSIALAASLGINTNMRAGTAGQDAGVVYLLFPGSAAKPPWPRTVPEIRRMAAAAFNAWGGIRQLKAVVGSL